MLKPKHILPALYQNHVEAFLEMMAAQFRASINTLEAYRRDLTDFLCAVHPLEMTCITHQEVSDYLTALHDRHYTAATVARRLSSLQRFFLFLKEEGVIVQNPLVRIQRPKSRKALPSVMTQEEVSRLIDSITADITPHSIRLTVFLEMLYSTGLRVTELISLPLRSLLFDPKTKSLSDTLMVIGKGRKERVVHLNEPTQQALLIYLSVRHEFLRVSGTKGDKWLFPSRSKEGHLTRQRLGQLLKEQAHVAQINPELVHPHALRHAFATHLLHNGADLLVIQKLMGHEDIASTQIYTHITANQLAEILNTHHPLCRENNYIENPI